MLSLLQSKQPTTIALVIILFVVLKLPFAFYPLPYIAPLSSLFGLIGVFLKEHFLFSFILAQVALISQAFWFNILFSYADYHERFSFVPAFYFILVSSLIPEFNFLSIYTIITFILLALFHTALVINLRKSAKLEAFNLGVLGGLLAILDIHFVLLVPFLFLMLYVLKPFRIQEFLLLLFGWLLPFYFYISFAYLFDIHINIVAFSFQHFEFFRFERKILSNINFILTAILVLFSFISLRGILQSTGFKRKKNVSMLIAFFLGLLLMLIFSGRHAVAISQVLFIPISIFLSLLMLRIRKKKLGEIFNAVYIALILTVNLLRIYYT